MLSSSKLIHNCFRCQFQVAPARSQAAFCVGETAVVRSGLTPRDSSSELNLRLNSPLLSLRTCSGIPNCTIRACTTRTSTTWGCLMPPVPLGGRSWPNQANSQNVFASPTRLASEKRSAPTHWLKVLQGLKLAVAVGGGSLSRMHTDLCSSAAVVATPESLLALARARGSGCPKLVCSCLIAARNACCCAGSTSGSGCPGLCASCSVATLPMASAGKVLADAARRPPA